MPGTTNIQLFNPYLNNALMDTEYGNNQTRQNGVFGQLADSSVHNKLFAQLSSVSVAIANFIVAGGYDALDRDPAGITANFRKTIIDLLNGLVDSRVPDVRASDTTYKLGDCVTDVNIPLWAELECIKAGTTTGAAFAMPNIQGIGQQIADGAVMWSLRAKRFNLLKGVPTPFMGKWTTTELIGGIRYPIHQELDLPMLDCRFCDGTNGTIDMRGLMLRAKNSIDDDDLISGADTRTISQNNLPNATVKTDAVAIGLHVPARNVGGFVSGFVNGANLGGGLGYNETYSAAIVPPIDVDWNLQFTVNLNNGIVVPIATIPRNRQFAFIQRVY